MLKISGRLLLYKSTINTEVKLCNYPIVNTGDLLASLHAGAEYAELKQAYLHFLLNEKCQQYLT